MYTMVNNESMVFLGFYIVLAAMLVAGVIATIGARAMFFNNDFRRWNYIMTWIVVSMIIMVIGFGIAMSGCE